MQTKLFLKNAYIIIISYIHTEYTMKIKIKQLYLHVYLKESVLMAVIKENERHNVVSM